MYCGGGGGGGVVAKAYIRRIWIQIHIFIFLIYIHIHIYDTNEYNTQTHNRIYFCKDSPARRLLGGGFFFLFILAPPHILYSFFFCGAHTQHSSIIWRQYQIRFMLNVYECERVHAYTRAMQQHFNILMYEFWIHHAFFHICMYIIGICAFCIIKLCDEEKYASTM